MFLKKSTLGMCGSFISGNLAGLILSEDLNVKPNLLHHCTVNNWKFFLPLRDFIPCFTASKEYVLWYAVFFHKVYSIQKVSNIKKLYF